MPRSSASVRQRKSEKHRLHFNNINNDKFDIISRHVALTGDIDLITQYRKLLIAGNFAGIDHMIASFSNEAYNFEADVDVDSSRLQPNIEINQIDIHVRDDNVTVVASNDADGPFSITEENLDNISDKEDSPQCVEIIHCASDAYLGDIASLFEHSVPSISSSTPPEETMKPIPKRQGSILIYAPDVSDFSTFEHQHLFHRVNSLNVRAMNAILFTNKVDVFHYLSKENGVYMKVAIVPVADQIVSLFPACLLCVTPNSVSSIIHIRTNERRLFDKNKSFDIGKFLRSPRYRKYNRFKVVVKQLIRSLRRSKYRC